MKSLAALVATLALALLTACASLPGDVARAPSQAIDDVAATELARLADASTPADRRHLSGLKLLPDAAQALDARVALARRAQVSLDLQYYLIAADGTGRAMLRELRDAAARGVRVRLLLDDLHASEHDELLAALAAHARVEVRLFNPLPARGGSIAGRLLRSAHDFERVNRRMHNKLFIADNRWAVTGGRNVGDEYFMRGDGANFVDMDVLASGPAVQELSALFDRFWNSELAFPVGSVVATPARAVLDRLAPAPSRPDAGAHLDELAAGMVFAPATLVADAPDKALPAGAGAAPTAMEHTLALFNSARSEVLIASPYFIPGARGLELMRDGVGRGVRIEVTTNSLAATDEPLAHRGYMRYRLAMLRLGVALSELRPGDGGPPAGFGSFRSSLSRLHAWEPGRQRTGPVLCRPGSWTASSTAAGCWSGR